MVQSDTPTPRFKTMHDYEVAHLLGGPDSDRLEFDSAYYAAEFAAFPQRPHTLLEFFVENPDAIVSHATQLAGFTAMSFFGKENNELRANGVERAFMNATTAVVEGYIAAKRAPEFTVDNFPFSETRHVPTSELREAGRLALQTFKVYEATVQTGEVPQL